MKAGDIIRILAGLGLFAAAYALINSELLIHSILYRLAANDQGSAILASISIALQSLIMLGLTVLLPRRLFGLLLVLVGISAAINLTYSDILGEVVDAPKISWMIEEARQSANAVGQFAGAFAIAGVKVLTSLCLLAGARRFLRPTLLSSLRRFSVGRRAAILLSAAALLIFALIPLSLAGPVGSERNAFVYAAQVAMAEPPPDRASVTVVPSSERQIEKILWLIDESVSHDVFQSTIKPGLATRDPVDFGEAWAMGNCSTPANVALRSGVDVMNVDSTTDLRATPSIWRYAKKAGYRTILLDGQVNGPPQNMLLPPERELIDDYAGVAAGLDTDRKMAKRLNALVRSPGKTFVYAVLRGVHFQYTDHYPGGASEKGAPLVSQYRKAVAYSKQGVFDALLDGVDRDKVAIIYTSDHGQNIAEGAPPHCSAEPGADEFSVPLIAFLPPELTATFGRVKPGPRSASQIFPATLQWMGYASDYAQSAYDNDLSLPSKRPVWFGRNVAPVNAGDAIAVHPIPEDQLNQ